VAGSCWRSLRDLICSMGVFSRHKKTRRSGSMEKQGVLDRMGAKLSKPGGKNCLIGVLTGGNAMPSGQKGQRPRRQSGSGYWDRRFGYLSGLGGQSDLYSLAKSAVDSSSPPSSSAERGRTPRTMSQGLCALAPGRPGIHQLALKVHSAAGVFPEKSRMSFDHLYPRLMDVGTRWRH